MRLLLAEDERMLSDALVTMLQHNNYSVDAVYDGREALNYLESGEYDAAILDIMMPEVDGLTVLRTIRAAGSTLPVLLLTAKSQIDDRVEGLDSGADDYLTKPFSLKELMARIRAITRRQPEMTDPVLRFNDLTLRRSDAMLQGPGGELRLANKEYQIMEMLLTSPLQVIPTERFMEKVWGYDSDAEINVVWVNISGLRKKIAGLGAHVQIKAARGVGYLLAEAEEKE
ncbi:MAG: response regulator transcription factor [Firmicutes bacterium]|nr:response regulator transcription factor [Bacillota bacterium]MCR4710789.1 response regulator transcription factor [Clostridia bacterium]